MLRARWRELETELRTRLNGHAGRNPGYSQANVLTGHRASSRPYSNVVGASLATPAEAPGVFETISQRLGRKFEDLRI